VTMNRPPRRTGTFGTEAQPVVKLEPVALSKMKSENVDGQDNTTFAPCFTMLKLGLAVLLSGNVPENLPALSHVARPSNRPNAIPFSVRPSSPTLKAGTCNRSHCPGAGKVPI